LRAGSVSATQGTRPSALNASALNKEATYRKLYTDPSYAKWCNTPYTI